MNSDPFSTLCIGRLTRLLELNSTEDLQAFENCGYVTLNIELKEERWINDSVQIVIKIMSEDNNHNHIFKEDVSADDINYIVKLMRSLKKQTNVEGLFRISGNKRRQQQLKLSTDDLQSDLQQDNCPYSPHDVAGIIKQFFADLTEPLLTKELYDCYQQLAGKLAGMNSESVKLRKIETLKFLFLLLPPLNRLLLYELVHLLSAVVNDETNKMSAYNLGVIFAPNIVCTRKQLKNYTDICEEIEPLTELVKFVIENCEDVFQIPEDFLAEGRDYLEKIALDQDDVTVEVPMKKSYCQQINTHQYYRGVKEHTDNALTLLYAQVMEMPDGRMKDEFLEKFRKSYPGTPMFIPKSVKKVAHDLSNSNAGGIATPTPSVRTKCSRDNEKESKPYYRQAMTPSTPKNQKMKDYFRKLRSRSVDIFKSKPPDTSSHAEGSSSFKNKRTHLFSRSHRLPKRSASRKGLTKSISSPALNPDGKGTVTTTTATTTTANIEPVRKTLYPVTLNDDETMSNKENASENTCSSHNACN